MSKAKGLVCAGIGVVALSFLASAIFGKVLGAAIVPAVLGGGLCTAGLIISLRGKDRTWALAGGLGVILSVAGLILGIVHIAKYVHDAKVRTAIDTVRQIARSELKFYEQERVSRGMTGELLPHQFIGGGDVTQSACCPEEKCEGRPREFTGQPWDDLGMRGLPIPNPWNFAVNASGEGDKSRATVFAWADFGCDGEITQVSQELTVTDGEPRSGAVIFDTLQKDAALKERTPPKPVPQKRAEPEPVAAVPEAKEVKEEQEESTPDPVDAGPPKAQEVPVDEPVEKKTRLSLTQKRSAPMTMVKLGRPTIKGGANRDLVQRIVKSRLSTVKSCYSKALGANFKLSGRAVVKFSIGPSGRVKQASIVRSTLKNKSLEGCLKNTIKGLRFPSPRGGGIATVTYPFSFLNKTFK